ncbi:class I SAM-dependent methyltransferase [Paenibacillus sp. CGMCC 1.16610]|uniref:Methyltransferase domain-containing protein n=1 Tax=Paenibacillus anseongense TaxID=2682845 RepID=A0ABW9U5Z7_9BACL|nr:MULTISPECIES: class I SAM-dependent methyltransferase [Paenibacillus]MBA2936898.1 class I SAM-dependent methyltransferase [Paenibacillus sp. CGMCC 1.16610]MVQ33225.1 methyltransferase domain-containing protein [Paenibacillus anseongense]
MKESIFNYDDVLNILDTLLKEQSRFNWDNFYSDKEKEVPFFVNLPDENLVQYFNRGYLKSGKVLELGCGPGRNAIYFAEQGCTVDAVDLSQEALNWAKQRAENKNVSVNFIKQNIFELDIEEGTYDIVYDSGCFHHIAPHRRMSYLELLNKALKPNSFFAITCFKVGGELGGSDISDWEVYRLRSLRGGLGYTDEKLREVFNGFQVIELRDMLEMEASSEMFGIAGLLTALFKKQIIY